MKKSIPFIAPLFILIILVACSSSSDGDRAADASTSQSSQQEAADSQNPSPRNGMGMMGPGAGMMARHHADIPEEYAGLKNTVEADDASLARGGEIYTANCAVCHGDGGMGDGPGAVGLDPAPVAIAHTSQMLGDDYLYWRVSEGGAMEPFNSAMVAWKGVLDEQARWDVINYVQALGSGRVTPGQNVGGAAYDPAIEAANQEEMLNQALEQGLITQEEAAVFAEAHEKVDRQMIQMRSEGAGGSMDELMDEVVSALVAAGDMTREQADIFLNIHDRLGQAGLMQ